MSISLINKKVLVTEQMVWFTALVKKLIKIKCAFKA